MELDREFDRDVKIGCLYYFMMARCELDRDVKVGYFYCFILARCELDMSSM